MKPAARRYPGRYLAARLARFVHRRPVALVLVALALSVGSGFLVRRLHIETDFARLLPDSDPSVHELNRIKERVGGIGPLSVVITGQDLTQVVAFLDVLADSLEHNPLIGAVVRGPSVDFFSRNRLLYMQVSDLDTVYARLDDYVESEKLRRSPLYVSLDDDPPALDFADLQSRYDPGDGSDLERHHYLTQERNGAILRLYPTGVITDVEFSSRLLADLERTVAAIGPARFDASIRCRYEGSFKNTLDQYSVIVGDLKSSALYSIGGVLLVIVLYFRNALAGMLIALPLLMSLLWTFAVAAVAIGSLNQITVGLFAILFGLGVDFGIHIFARYREARRRALPADLALVETLRGTGRALITSGLTTSLAFYSLMFTEFKGFSELGFIVGTGILLALAAMLLVWPALLLLGERAGLLHFPPLEQLRPSRVHTRFPRPRLVVVFCALVTGASILHVGDIEFEYDFSKLRPDLSEPDPGPHGSLPQSLRDTESPAIVLTGTEREARAVVAAVDSVRDGRGPASTVRSVRSVYSLLPAQQGTKLERIERIRDRLDAAEALIPADQQARVDSLRRFLDVHRLTLADLPADLTRSFTDRQGKLLDFVAIYASVALRDGRNAMAFAREIGTIQTPSGKTYHASSAHIIFARMLSLMRRDGTLAVALTLSVVAAALAVDLRHLGQALLVLAPLLTAITWVVGLMVVLDLRLNLYNIVTFPTIIGMGIDNGVHIFHRYREEGAGSLRLVLRTTGAALIATSLTTMVGFAGLIPSHHPALRSIGTLSLLGLACTFATAVLLLPALLQVLEDRVHSASRSLPGGPT